VQRSALLVLNLGIGSVGVTAVVATLDGYTYRLYYSVYLYEMLRIGSIVRFISRVLYPSCLLRQFLGTIVFIVLSIYMESVTCQVVKIKQFNLFYDAHQSLLIYL
jgi:hypothetical protein